MLLYTNKSVLAVAKMVKVMDQSMASFLLKEDIDERVVKLFEAQGCLSTSTCASRVDNIKELTEIVQAGPSKVLLGESPRLKVAFKKMKAIEVRKIQLLAEGLQEVPSEDPLPSYVYKDVLGNACCYYRWSKFSSFAILCDGQFGKLRREFQAFQPSNFKVAKARLLALSAFLPDPKRSKVTEKVSLIFESEEIDD